MRSVLYLVILFLFINSNVCEIYTDLDNDEVWNTFEYNVTLSPNLENVIALSACSLNVTWSCDECAANNVSKYVVHWDINLQHEVGNGTYNYIIQGLLADTSYEVYVSAIYATGEEFESSSNTTFTEIGDPPDIISLDVDEITDTRIHLRWNVSSDECQMKEYDVRWNGAILCDSGKMDAGEDSSTEMDILLYGLTPYTNYSVSVTAVSTDGINGNETILNDLVTSEGEPGPPESVTTEVLNSSSINLNWIPPLECNGILRDYIISWTLMPSGTIIGTQNLPDTFVQINNLSECSIYEFSVQATTTEGIGDPTTNTNQTAPESPPPVTNLDSSNATSQSVYLTWTPPDTLCPVLNYNLHGIGIILWNEEENDIINITFSTSDDFYDLQDLTPWTNYTICISATTDGGTSNISCDDFPTLEDVPSEPINLRPVFLSTTEVMLQWDPPKELNGILLYYNVTWESESTDMTFETTNETEFNITELLSCLTYDINVVGATSIGEGNPATINVTLKSETPPPPTINQCYKLNSTSIEVEWDAPNTTCLIKYYQVTIKGVILWNGSTTNDTGTTVQQKIELQELVPYTNYTISVKARTEKYGNSDSCDETTDEDVPYSPTDLTVVENSITSSSFTITWKEPVVKNGILKGFYVNGTHGIAQYVYYTVPNDTYKLKFGNLQSKTTYDINVLAETGAGYGLPATTRAVTVKDSNVGVALGITIPLLLILVALGFGYYYRDDISKRMRTIRTHPVGAHEEASDFSTTPIPLFQLKSYINKLENVRLLDAEFNSLASKSYKGLVNEGTKTVNARMNRYANIIPFDETRVPLKRGLSTYINANYINSFLKPKFFIAAQGPTDNTLEDFWNLLWQEHIDTIVMLTACVENGKDKCTQYWPISLGYGTDLGVYTIQNINEESTPLFTHRMFEVHHRDENRKRLIRHYQYLTWPDFGAPSKEEDLLKVLFSIKQNLSATRDDNIILVHCSAGVGRTGTFICLWNVIEAINHGIQSLSIAKEVLELRRQRVSMVQSKEQYLYLCKCVHEYYENQAKWKPKDGSPTTNPAQDQMYGDPNASTSAFYNMSFEPSEEFEGNLI